MRFGSCLVGLAMATIATGCLITGDVEITPAPGTLTSGSMMCAVCWNGPFCLNGDTGEFVSGTGCPDGFTQAEQANRVISSVQRLDDFFCIVPDGKVVSAPPIDDVVNPNGVFCNTAPDPGAHKHVDPCRDVPISCRTTPFVDPLDLEACAPEDLPDPSDPACDPNTNVGPTRFACEATEEEALSVGKLINAVSVYGLDVPDGDAPEPYCFLSCVQSITNGCDDELIDPPEIRSSSFIAGVDAVTSSALTTIVLGGISSADTVALEGQLAFDVPIACRGPLPPGAVASCDSVLSMIDLRSIGDLVLAGEAISGIRLHAPVPLPTQVTTAGATTIITTGPALVYVSATVGRFGRAGVPYVVQPGLEITIDWSTGEAASLTTLQAEDGSSDLLLDVNGPLTNQPPTASAGPDQLLECSAGGTTVSLSASGSSDPDGDEELTSFVWSSVLDGVRRSSNGVEWIDAPVASVGTTYFTVQVGDDDAASDTDTMAVTVEDTTAPAFSSASLATSCLWPPNHEMLLFEVGEELVAAASDACDGAVSVEIVSVSSNQPANGPGDGNTTPDVVYGPDAFCIRAERSGPGQAPRVYTIVVAATDGAGNTTTVPLTVQVPHSKKGLPGCATPGSIQSVAATDPRCSAGSAP